MRILLFIGLKIVEIALFIFVPYGVGRLIDYFWFVGDDGAGTTWLLGLLGIILTLTIALLLFAVLVANWEWAGYILSK